MEVMVLGVYHFNSQLNLFKASDDVTTEQRQLQLSEIIEYIIRYCPTKIAIERTRFEQSVVDSEYSKFRLGTFQLTSHECHQIGFQVAKQLGHDRLYAIDIKNEQNDATIGDVFDFAKQHQKELHRKMNNVYQNLNDELQHRLETTTLRQVLLWLNQENILQEVHQPYLWMTQVGDDDNRIGLNWVSRWYERNLTIYSNLMKNTTSDDRWLVVYGHGHATLLREFLQDNGTVTVVPVSDVLYSSSE